MARSRVGASSAPWWGLLAVQGGICTTLNALWLCRGEKGRPDSTPPAHDPLQPGTLPWGCRAPVSVSILGPGAVS